MNVRIALLLLTSCAFGAQAERQQEDARLRDQLVKVQEAACLAPARAPTCTGDLRFSYDDPAGGRVDMWCAEDGQPRVKSANVDGPMPLVVWNALERTVLAADGCVHSQGWRVDIASKAVPKKCADPRFDIHELLQLAYDAAEEGPRPTPHVAPRASSKCPAFADKLWP